jgi:hypothetical protein
MTRVGRDKVRGELISPAVQASPPSVKHSLTKPELEALRTKRPEWVRASEVELSLDKAAVLEAYQKGAVLPDGVTVERGKHVRFY